MALSQSSTSTTSNPSHQHSLSLTNPAPTPSDSNRSNQNSTQIIDVKEIASSIREKLFRRDQLQPTSQCSIFEVPDMLRRHNVRAFMPELVSIGPLHHENTQLQPMENIKVLYLKCLLRQTRGMELETLVNAMGSIEQDCRKCYAEVVDLSRDKFIEMMLIDGCFILEFLHRYLENKKEPNVQGLKEDPVFKKSWMARKIIADLLLLENQLPWCVLETLFNLMPSLKTTHQQLDDLVAFSFSEYKMFPAAHSPLSSHEKHAHILDCFRNCLVGSCTVKQPNRLLAASGWIPVMPVTELFRNQIRLTAKYGHNILDVKFEDGEIIIPAMVIEENTESVFRNLIAFEHCDPSKGYEITSYGALLDCLIKSPADALHLKQKNILRINGLSSQDTASFINRLIYNNDTSFHGFLYSDLCQRVNTICSSKWRSLILAFVQAHFGDPWAFSTFVFGVVFSLALSFAQTYYAALSYDASKPANKFN